MHMGLLNVCECILYRHCCVSQSCFSLLPTDAERCVSSVSCTLPVPAHCLVGVRFYPLWGSAGWSSICQHLPLHQQGGKGQLQRTIHIFLFFDLCAKLHFIFNPFTDTYTLCKCHNDYFRRFRRSVQKQLCTVELFLLHSKRASTSECLLFSPTDWRQTQGVLHGCCQRWRQPGHNCGWTHISSCPQLLLFIITKPTHWPARWVSKTWVRSIFKSELG